jgi:hypothetical protein
MDPLTTAGKLANYFGISPQTAVTDFKDSLEMKSFHLGWVAYDLTEASNVKIKGNRPVLFLLMPSAICLCFWISDVD